MYWIGILATTVVAVAIVHAAGNSFTHERNIHLTALVDPFQKYECGAAETFHNIVKTQLSRIGATTLQHESCAVVFHGRMGAGKSSVIERLLMKPRSSIASGKNIAPGGHTVKSCYFKLKIGHQNSCYVFDTPGFGDKPDQAKFNIEECFAAVSESIKTLNVPLFRMYFVLSHTNNPKVIGEQLKTLKEMYGDAIAERIRFIVNKSDILAWRSESYIKNSLIDNLQSIFREQFGKDSDRIIFTCAEYRSEVGCIGQLIDDICDYHDGDFINIDGSIIENIRTKAKQEHEVLNLPSISESERRSAGQQLKRQAADLIKERNEIIKSLQSLAAKQAEINELYEMSKVSRNIPDTATMCSQYQDDTHSNPDILFLIHALLRDNDDFFQMLKAKFDQPWEMTYNDLMAFWNRIHSGPAEPQLMAELNSLNQEISSTQLSLDTVEAEISNNQQKADNLRQR